MGKKPNIVFILIDDMGWRDLSCYGSTFYETPNIDKLFSEGMHFTNAYAACPVCSPTRASILTGKYPANVGVTDYIGGHTKGIVIDAPYIDHLPLSEKSLAKTLKNNGYNTWHVGKWHLGGEEYYPEKHGFDVNIGGCHWGHPKGGYFSPWNMDTLPENKEGEYLTDRLTDEAIKLIENSSDDKSFFLNMWYYSVHTPIQAKEEKIKKYEDKAVKLGLDKINALEEGENFSCEHKRDQKVVRRIVQSDPTYAAMIESLDENIGRLVKAIDDKGETDNTIIIFTSDNGGLSTAEGSPTCNAPLAEGKGWMYEGGTREPLIVKWPSNISEGSMCDVPVTSPDFYPTLLEVTEINLMPEQHQDGVSILPLLKGEHRIDREAVFWHYPHYGNQGGTPGCSIRLGNYKLIEFFEDNRLELYDLEKDIGEKENLINTFPDITKDLHNKLINWRESVHAKIPEPNPDWNELD
ncbi:MAG: sulfatase [Planctomycetota bacterium]|nr:MAG: sulfatase [Planctomycetota bacterium]